MIPERSTGTTRRGRLAAILLPPVLAGCGGGISLQEEAELGASYAAEVQRQVPLITDPALVGALNRFGRSLSR